MIDHRKDGEKDDGKNNKSEVVLYGGDVSKEITGQSKQTHPDNTTEKVVGNEGGIMHFTDTGDERSKSPNNRDKAGEKNGFAAVFIKKFICLIDMLFIDGNMRIGDDFFTKEMTDPIIGGITHNCSK